MIRLCLRETLTLCWKEIGPEPVFDMSESGTRLEPVPNVDEVGREPPSMFEENVDLSFDRVADFEKDEGVDTPIVIVQPKTLKIPQTSEGQKKKELNCLRDEQIFRLFVNLGLCKLKPLLPLHNPNLLHPKLLPNHPKNPTD